jgi:hypothetical protein
MPPPKKSKKVEDFISTSKPCASSLAILNSRSDMTESWNKTENGYWVKFMIKATETEEPEAVKAVDKEHSAIIAAARREYHKAKAEGNPGSVNIRKSNYLAALKNYADAIRSVVSNPFS